MYAGRLFAFFGCFSDLLEGPALCSGCCICCDSLMGTALKFWVEDAVSKNTSKGTEGFVGR